MNLHDHAVEELKYLRGNDEPDEMQDLIEKNILEIVDTFSKQGHSGSSASYCLYVLERVLRFRPVTPLTGKDDEWREVRGGVFQNKRCGKVFKQADRFNGQAYNIDGKIFSDDGGESWYTNSDSFVPIEFPYTVKEPEKVFIEKITK